MEALGDAVAGVFAVWGQWPITRDLGIARERDIYGTADPYEIARVVDRFCATHLGAPIAASLFYASSQGSASGVGLADGRRVVVKVHTPAWAPAFLDAVHTVQRHLAGRGFPCPRPLLGPTRLGHGYATVEELVDGDDADAHRPVLRRAMAETLALLVASARDLVDVPGVGAALRSRMSARRPVDDIWPEPHSPIFDFKATTAGAAWIDGIAAQAKVAMARGAGEEVIGHTDWSAQNCRFVDERIRVVYDWDSHALDKETIIVAQAATNFPYNWTRPQPPFGPSHEEARAFVREYEGARGCPFTSGDWATMAATATYSLAYGARLEHSLHSTEDFAPGGARARLILYGDAFLQCE